MEYKDINLFWTIIWFIILSFGALSFFWKYAAIVVVLIAAVMGGMYLGEYIHYKRLK